MLVIIRRRAVIAAIFCLVAVISAVLAASRAERTAASAQEKKILVIDPGHGGIDGGALAADGTKESAINLAISQKMRAIAELYGEKTVMTRDTEESKVSISEYSEHNDLLRRADIANKLNGAVLISVHQNNFPTVQPRGAQILYAPSDGSRELGLLAQSALVGFADSHNRRVAEKAPGKLLLTNSVGCPAILAECGFMSNPEEASMLRTGNYQLKLACALTAAYIQFAKNITPA
jgi:N-acetylmuramoyl-L-alanine amidase